jgi:aminobenzoyl-glutamate utilization protein B
MTTLSQEKQAALDWIEAHRQRFSDFHLEIWHYAESAFREYRSARAYVELLRQEGFTVEEGSGEMPTAFMATWGEGRPVLGSYAEYDAVPENSQQPVPYRAPREGLHPWAAGHTDPHSALGTAALIGILGAKATMQQHGVQGTLKLFGEPAEKVCGSKPVHAAKGYYDDLDAAISYHPHTTNTTIWDIHCGSYWSVAFTFECAEPEKWIDPRLMASPDRPHTVARCPGAIDAVCLMYTTTKYTKEAMFPHTGTWTLNEYIMAAGQCTSDNLPPRFSQIQYSWRSPTLDIQERIFQVLEANAKHAAQVTGCEVSHRWVTKTRVGLPNHALADLTYRNLELVGAPSYSEEARGFAREIQKNLGLTPMDDPFSEANQRLTSPQEWEPRSDRACRPGRSTSPRTTMWTTPGIHRQSV